MYIKEEVKIMNNENKTKINWYVGSYEKYY